MIAAAIHSYSAAIFGGVRATPASFSAFSTRCGDIGCSRMRTPVNF